jgi:fructokinase
LKTNNSPQSFNHAPSTRASRARLVVGIGEALWDQLPGGRHVGGAPLNFAYISSLFGQRSVIASRIGIDHDGEEMLRDLSLRGLDVGYIQRDMILPTGTAAVTVSADGQPAYEIQQPAAWDTLQWSPEWEELAKQADAVCFGTLAQRSEQSQATINAFLEATRPDCVRIFDVNLRAPFFSRDLIVNSIRLASIVKLNEKEFVEVSEIIGLSSGNLPEDVRTFAGAFDLDLVCLTRGEHGSLLATPQQTVVHPGVTIKVVDTVGAGDAFTAAVAWCWIAHLGLKETSEIANRWAGWVASRAGAMPVIDETLRRQMLP